MGIQFGLPSCNETSKAGEYCQMLVGALSPTQNAVGMDEVIDKTATLAVKKEQALSEYLYTRPVPVVIGRVINKHGEASDEPAFYQIDHHHLARAYWDMAGAPNAAGVDRDGAFVVVRVVDNWYFIRDAKRFFKAMDKRRWLYPYDDGGGGPLNVSRLARHIKDLTNDPYRSLAWYVREGFGYFKDPTNPIFAEFQWANFFRTRVELGDALLDPGSGIDLRDIYLRNSPDDERDEVIAYAIALARSREAESLPGYFLS